MDVMNTQQLDVRGTLHPNCKFTFSYMYRNLQIELHKKNPFVSSTDEVMATDKVLLRIILENHILKNKIVLGQLYNGQQLETIGGKLLRVFIYRTVRPLPWKKIVAGCH